MCLNTPVCNVYRLRYYWFFEDASLLHGSSDTLLNRGVIPFPISTQTVTYITHYSHSQCIKICCSDSSLKCFKCWVLLTWTEKEKQMVLSVKSLTQHDFVAYLQIQWFCTRWDFQVFVLRRIFNDASCQKANEYVSHWTTYFLGFLYYCFTSITQNAFGSPQRPGRNMQGRGVWDVFGEKPSSHISLSKYSCWMFQAIAFTFVSTDCAVTLTWCIMQQDVCVYVCVWIFSLNALFKATFKSFREFRLIFNAA